MHRRLLQALGAAIGVIAALLVLEARSKPAPDLRPDEGAMLRETGGALCEIVIQYVAGDAIALPVYRSFLPQLPNDVRVHVLCPDQTSFNELVAQAGALKCTLHAVVTGHEMTVWSRDRWIALRPTKPGVPITLLAPTEEDASTNWPQREGDAKVAMDLAAKLHETVQARRLPLYFDGGDLLAADDSAVFVAPMVLTKNLTKTVASKEELLSMLAKATNRKTVLFDEAPEHHLGMYMMSAGDHTMLVGDPRLARPLSSSSFPELPEGPDWSDAALHRFDAVAEKVAAEGYKVIRIPTVMSPDNKTFLTYVNVITDEREGKKIVYLPAFQGAEPLNDAAAQVWRGVGYEVRSVDCTSSYRFFGNLHCLVNVLRRAREC